MLVCCCVEYYLRSPLSECIVQAWEETDVSDHWDEVEFRELLFKLKPEVVHWSLGVIIEHKLFDSEGCELAAELGSDRSCCSGNHDCLALEVLDYLFHGDLDFRTHEKVLDLDVSEGVVRLAVDHLVDRRSEEHLDAQVDRILDHAVFLKACLFFCCEKYCVCINCSYGVVKLLLCAYVEGLLLGDDVGYAALSELKEADDVIMRRVLQAWYERY